MTDGRDPKPRRAASAGGNADTGQPSASGTTAPGGAPTSAPARRALVDDGPPGNGPGERRGGSSGPLVQPEQNPARSVRMQRASSAPTAQSREADTVMIPAIPSAADTDTRVQPKIKAPIAGVGETGRADATAKSAETRTSGAPGVSPWARPGSTAKPATSAPPLPVAASTALPSPAAPVGTPPPPESPTVAPTVPRRSRSAGWVPDTGMLGRRRLLALGVAAAAVMLTVLTLVAYAAFGPQQTTVAGEPANPSATATGAPILSDESLLTDQEASKIDSTRSWQVTQTVKGRGDDLPIPACIGKDPNEVTAELSGWRTLSASGPDKTVALQLADAYSTLAQAKQIYAEYRNALATCSRGGTFYLNNAFQITGVGDESSAAMAVYQGPENETHSVVIARTGRIVQVLDVTRLKKPVEMRGVVDALSTTVNRQCTIAGGLCASGNVTVEASAPGKPDVGKGFLAASDVPRISPGAGAWGEPEIKDQIELSTSACVNEDLSQIGGPNARRQQATMLLTNDLQAPESFGLDEIVITMGTAKEANDVRAKMISGIKSCADRKLTAKATQVGGEMKTTVGKTPVDGAAFTAEQKQNNAQTRYRLGVQSVGPKVIFLQATTDPKFDFTDAEWRAVVTRAAERSQQF